MRALQSTPRADCVSGDYAHLAAFDGAADPAAGQVAEQWGQPT
jgi:hypothetical protein